MNRKQRREMQKKVGKENSQKLAEKIFQFDKLPDECLACLKPFDKKSKEMARTWNVVVRDKDTGRPDNLFVLRYLANPGRLVETLKVTYGRGVYKMLTK